MSRIFSGPLIPDRVIAPLRQVWHRFELATASPPTDKRTAGHGIIATGGAMAVFGQCTWSLSQGHDTTDPSS